MLVKAETYYRWEVNKQGFEDYFKDRKLRRATTLEKLGGTLLVLGVVSFVINLSRVLIPLISQVESKYTLLGMGVILAIAGGAIYSTGADKAREARNNDS